MNTLKKIIGYTSIGLLLSLSACKNSSNTNKKSIAPVDNTPKMTLQDSIIVLEKEYIELNGTEYEKKQIIPTYSDIDSNSTEYKNILQQNIKLIHKQKELEQEIKKLKHTYDLLEGKIHEERRNIESFTEKDSTGKSFNKFLKQNIKILQKFNEQKTDLHKLREKISEYEKNDSTSRGLLDTHIDKYISKNITKINSKISHIRNEEELFKKEIPNIKEDIVTLSKINDYLERKTYLNPDKLTGIIRNDKYFVEVTTTIEYDVKDRNGRTERKSERTYDVFELNKKEYDGYDEGDYTYMHASTRGIGGSKRSYISEKIHKEKFYEVYNYNKRVGIDRNTYVKILEFTRTKNISTKNHTQNKDYKIQFDKPFSKDVFNFY